MEGRRAFLVPNPLFPSSPPPVSGRGDIATQFAALRALFSNVDIAAQAPSVDAPTRGDAGGGRVVSVDATQTYSLPLLFAPSIAIAVTTTLHVTPDGVITRHTDAWRSVRVGSLPAARATTRAHDAAERNQSAERSVSRAQQRRAGQRVETGGGRRRGGRRKNRQQNAPVAQTAT